MLRHSPIQRSLIAAFAVGAAAQCCAAASPLEADLSTSERAESHVVPFGIGRLAGMNYEVQFDLAFKASEVSDDKAAAVPSGLQQAASVVSGSITATDLASIKHPTTGIGRSVGGKLSAVWFALQIMDGFHKKPKTDWERLEASWKVLHANSFYLTFIAPKSLQAPASNSVDDAFAQGVQLLDDLNIGCLTAQSRWSSSERQVVAGRYVPDLEHLRLYFCDGVSGHRDPGQTPKSENVWVKAQRIGVGDLQTAFDDGVFAEVVFHDIDKKLALKAHVDPVHEHSDGQYGRLMYERVKGKLPSGWVATFAESSADGQQHITIADNDREIALDVPPKPSR